MKARNFPFIPIYPMSKSETKNTFLANCNPVTHYYSQNKRKSRPEAYQRRVGRIFDILTADFLLLNRTGVQHKGFKCKLWRLGHAEGPIVAVMGAQFTSC
jgi:hypothetical protein